MSEYADRLLSGANLIRFRVSHPSVEARSFRYIGGLSLGISVRQIVRRELITGVLVGAVLGLAFLPIGILRWGEEDVALAVALSLLAACPVATVIAMALPALFQRLGRDPAFGSGPLATVAQDILSIVIYFAIASAIVD